MSASSADLESYRLAQKEERGQVLMRSFEGPVPIPLHPETNSVRQECHRDARAFVRGSRVRRSTRLASAGSSPVNPADGQQNYRS